MNEQISLFTINDKYNFQRFIGQHVGLGCGYTGTIVKIEPYYTIVKPDKPGGLLVGTPTTTYLLEV